MAPTSVHFDGLTDCQFQREPAADVDGPVIDGHESTDQEDSEQKAKTGAGQRVMFAHVALGIDHCKHQDGHEDPEQADRHVAPAILRGSLDSNRILIVFHGQHQSVNQETVSEEDEPRGKPGEEDTEVVHACSFAEHSKRFYVFLAWSLICSAAIFFGHV